MNIWSIKLAAAEVYVALMFDVNVTKTLRVKRLCDSDSSSVGVCCCFVSQDTSMISMLPEKLD